MKKLLLLTCVMLSAMITFAQETRKVAILETVDREGKVSYANKLILRSSLAKAITETPGYEAYDRTDMDAILGEQNFQRTGMVSNDQIKRLGEMTGAQYVLVAEAVVVDDQNLFIAAKLLDVETARTEITNNQMMGTSAKEIQRGCQLLASSLVKPVVVASSAQTNSHSKHEKTRQTVANISPVASGGTITKVSKNEYRMNGSVMDRKAYENFICQNCPAAWEKHLQAKRTIAAGWTSFSIGLPLTGMFGLLAIEDEWVEPNSYRAGFYQTSEPILVTSLVCGSSGIGITGLGIVLLAAGYATKYNTYKVYNKKCASSYASTPVTFNLTAGYNGIGLAMHF